ncbi:phosphoglucomutase [Thermodesulfobacteriota bacterium B35]
MTLQKTIETILAGAIVAGSHRRSDYFQAIRKLVELRNQARAPEERKTLGRAIDDVYALVRDEILTNPGEPRSPVKFGTSGWRGMLGKDIFVRSVAFVTAAILQLYRDGEHDPDLRQALGVADFAEMRERGCVVGFDNRFGGPTLALAVMNVLAANGVRILYAGEATTGILSASVLVRRAAFSINLTPSHNPLEYGGFKYNAADAGPAAAILTERITAQAREVIAAGESVFVPDGIDLQQPLEKIGGVVHEDALASWQQLVRDNRDRHGIDYDRLLTEFAGRDDIVVGVDAVHGASRTYISRLLREPPPQRLFVLRDQADVTFGGIAPEPSSINMQPVMTALAGRPEPLRVGAIIDPDGDRIRFTDGDIEISMNQFGAMAYHFLHEIKGKKGMVAKTVATSNLANSVAAALGEEVFETRVGFKEFKPVIGRALVCFEESDGISVIGHTPEKDAFIGLLLALDMVMTLGRSLGDYLQEVEKEYGPFFPARDGVEVAKKGEELRQALARLEKYTEGVAVEIGNRKKTIRQVITIDGRKMVFEDGSWIMIRPSGTEPKVRFYVEARDREETRLLVDRARTMLAEIGLL